MEIEPTAAVPVVVTESAAPSSAPVVASAPVPPQAAPDTPQAGAAPTAPAEPAAQADPAPEPSREPTLLEKFDLDQAAKAESKAEAAEKPAEPRKTDGTDGKPAEPDKAEGTPAEAEKAAEKPAPEPFKFAELEIPEGFAKRFDIPEAEVSKRIDQFNEVLLKDVDPNARRADLLNLHAQAMQEYADSVVAKQRAAWNDYNKDQVKATMGDAELGGAGHQTAMGAVARVRDALTRDYSKAEKQELNDFLVVTGAGSHRAFLRLMHRAARFADEPQIPNTTPQPTPDRGGKPGRRSSVMYDNQRSP